MLEMVDLIPRFLRGGNLICVETWMISVARRRLARLADANWRAA
jgi:hypothetical protein